MTAAVPAVGAIALVASRPLALLDEQRVPYTVGGPAGLGPWASIGAPDGARVHWWTGVAAPSRWSLGDSPLAGPLAPEAAVRALVARLDGTWERSLPVTAPDGSALGATWRSREGGTVLPFDPDAVLLTLRSESYRRTDRAAAVSATDGMRRAYYRLRPLMPRRLQIGMRRAFAHVQARAEFPRWPAEPALHDLCDVVLGAVADAARAPVPYLAAWPTGHDWAIVLTHDVETARGRDGIERVRVMEDRLGFRSSWNFVPERYHVPDELVAHLKAVGCEVGVHGLRHDGKDLESLATLEQRLPDIRRWARRWDAAGFRAPATHRVWEWMPRLGFEYDSSYPDTDPYEPMAGGCCSWLPFFNGDLVELPITLPQDHAVFVILRQDERLWSDKAALLRARGGMALTITHPDYLLDDGPFEAYARFLHAVADDARVWRALPGEVADWWRRRAATRLIFDEGGWRAAGPAADDAAVAFAAPGELGAGWGG